jgi:hypothetical protein
MSKFTKLESAIIASCLKAGMVNDLVEIKKVEDAGKNPLFTKEYIESSYKELIEKVDGMTRKK